jgi:hypothetical protein
MDKPDQVIIQTNLKILATAADLTNGTSSKGHRKIPSKGFPQTRLAHLNGDDALTKNQTLKAPSDGLYFRQLRHIPLRSISSATYGLA